MEAQVAEKGRSGSETNQLTKIYQNSQIALNDVSLHLEPGTVLGLLGANGAGKTTLLRLVIGLHRPTAGWAKVFGEVMTPNSADLRRKIGYIPTNPQFPKGLTPITYLDYMARLLGYLAMYESHDWLRSFGRLAFGCFWGFHRHLLQRNERKACRGDKPYQRA